MSLVEVARRLRKDATRAEQYLWYEHLRFCSPRVRRQHPMAGFILDFYCLRLKICIELDGAGHYTQEGRVKDAARTAILEGHGVMVIRFENRVVLEELEGVVRVLEGYGIKLPAPPARATP